jgi:hypothetical protein
MVKFHDGDDSVLYKVFNFKEFEDNDVLVPQYLMDEKSLGLEPKLKLKKSPTDPDVYEKVKIKGFYPTKSKQLGQNVVDFYSIVDDKEIRIKTVAFYPESKWTINDFKKVSRS